MTGGQESMGQEPRPLGSVWAKADGWKPLRLTTRRPAYANGASLSALPPEACPRSADRPRLMPWGPIQCGRAMAAAAPSCRRQERGRGSALGKAEYSRLT